MTSIVDMSRLRSRTDSRPRQTVGPLEASVQGSNRDSPVTRNHCPGAGSAALSPLPAHPNSTGVAQPVRGLRRRPLPLNRRPAAALVKEEADTVAQARSFLAVLPRPVVVHRKGV